MRSERQIVAVDGIKEDVPFFDSNFRLVVVFADGKAQWQSTSNMLQQQIYPLSFSPMTAICAAVGASSKVMVTSRSG